MVVVSKKICKSSLCDSANSVVATYSTKSVSELQGLITIHPALLVSVFIFDLNHRNARYKYWMIKTSFKTQIMLKNG